MRRRLVNVDLHLRVVAVFYKHVHVTVDRILIRGRLVMMMVMVIVVR